MMHSYERIIEIVDANLIYCLIPIIVTLFVVESIFKNRFETKRALNLVCWTIIIYTIITWAITILSIAIYQDSSVFVNHAIGFYKIAYWIMFLSALILPFSLLVNKLRTNFWYVLFIAFCMKIGGYLERFIIIKTSLHRDYLPEDGGAEFTDSIIYTAGIAILQGMVIAILTLGVYEMKKKRKHFA